MKTKLSENQIRERFASRRWAVKLNINCGMVNHDTPEPPTFSVVMFWPQRRDVNDRPLDRFVAAVEQAAAISLEQLVILDIDDVSSGDDLVIEWLAGLINSGPGMLWGDRWREKLNPDNFIVNLWLDEDDPATAEVVEYIARKSDEYRRWHCNNR